MSFNVDDFDFEHCEDEPIHIPESIQSYGYLFALHQDEGKIEIISENVHDLLNSDSVIGTSFFDILEEEADYEFLQDTYNRAKAKKTRLPVRVILKKELCRDTASTEYYAVVYQSGPYFVIELEPAVKFRETYPAQHYMKLYALSIAPKFKTFKSLEIMAQEVVDTIKYITEMERVVLYKFNKDGSGKVIAEAKDSDMESYMDLYYPASDIPKQARELYRKNWVRLTPNVDLASSRLIPTPEESGRKPLDMTHSLLRSISPIHKQYVRNQGLKSSFSMSLVTHENLWGMISCHSRHHVYVPQNVRLQCENLSQLFSWHLYAKEEELFIEKKRRAEQAITEMLDKTSPNNPIVDVFKSNSKAVLDILDADGFIFYSEPQIITIGDTPDFDTAQEIYDLATDKGQQTFVSSKITDYIKNEAGLNGTKGVLLISFNEKRNFFTAWFRKEKKEVQKWAGTENEKSITASKKERLTPRKSFKVHIKKITGKSADWDENDLEMASRFNRVFLAHALETHEKMRQNLTNLEEQDRHKNEFLATLAHELRNPLSPISTGISLLEMEDDKDVQYRVIDTMKRQVGHMTKMINDLLEVSRITQGKVKLDKKNLPIHEIIESAVETCSSLIREKDHNLVIDIPEKPLWIYGDPTRLSQIFANILNNAAKYTDPGGKIHLRVKQKKDQVSVTVEDNGLGIPQEKLDVIFTMFTQVDAHSTHTKGGLGIGLTLVQKLLALHDGKIYARSEGTGEGSEFEIILPLIEEKKKSQPPVRELLSKKKIRQQKILIVDDNKDITDMYDMLLQTRGYQTQTAQSAQEAIRVFKDFKPDFALLDIGMPDIDGYQLCGMLRDLPESENTVFFSQSGWGSKKDIEKAYKSGFHEHFVKPLDRTELEAAINKYTREDTE